MMNTSQLQVIDPHTLREWLEHESVLLVDVREPGEYSSERIPGAKLQPLSQFNPEQIRLSSGQKLVLYCQSGNRSSAAAHKCLEAGFPLVNHLGGGIATWKQAGYGIEKSANAPISIFRQVQIVAGSLVLGATILGAIASPYFLLVSGFVGAGLMFAGISNTCAMGLLLAKLPYNQRWGNKL
ncbi:MAG: rhodanese-like domain-containing protein [Pseudanabaenaceae cyanobacterium bins.68]|nr:rhodanese-like domain-containing protein [Pseudanabaenaceae cyanobacterium bins.68]